MLQFVDSRMPSSISTCTLCAIAVAFLATSIATPFIATSKHPLHRAFQSTLDHDQNTRYEHIALHRRNLYLQGLILGVIVACLVVGVVMRVAPLSNDMSYGCLAVVVLFVVEFLYYMLSPKGEYMVTVLKTQKQREAWLKVYRHMQVSMYGSFACALVAAFVFFTFVMPCGCVGRVGRVGRVGK